MKTKFRLQKTARYFLYTLLAVVILTSCETKQQEKEIEYTKQFTVITDYDSGWSWSQTRIQADSIQMISLTEANVYVDGTNIKVFADKISFYSNNR